MVPGLGLHFLVKLCLWAVNFTSVSQFFSLSLKGDTAARVELGISLPPVRF